MTSTTYTTPAIPRQDFDDFRPGKRLDTVAQNMKDIRAAYQATRVRRIDSPAGIHFQVTGPIAEIRKLAALYGD